MIKVGILGAGNIANRFADALKFEQKGELFAISGRNEEKLNTFAKKHSVKEVFLSHEELLECKEIDAVYISLPHHLHKEWVIKALNAKKAVLVEKPAVMCKDEMLEVKKAAKENKVLFMEAHKERFVPAYCEFKKRLNEGQFGQISSIKASLCNDMPVDDMRAANTYHYQEGVGGALLDCGTYCASIIEDLTSGLITPVYAEGVHQYGVDVYVDCKFKVGGTQVELETAFDRAKPRNAEIITDFGKVTLEDLHRSQRMIISMNEKQEEILDLPYDHDDFYSQIHHFIALLEMDKIESDIMPIDGSVRIAEILDFVREKIKN